MVADGLILAGVFAMMGGLYRLLGLDACLIVAGFCLAWAGLRLDTVKRT